MDLRDLRYFVAVAEELHFGRAAARLRISPPPLTQRIKALEQELDVLLLRRTKRSVALTAAGSALLVEARRLLIQADGLAATVHRAARGEIGHLRAGVVGSAIFSQARDVQATLARLLPDVRLVWHEMSSVEQMESLRDNRLDLGLVTASTAPEGVVLGRTIREPLVVALPSTHPLASRSTIALQMLRDEVFILGARHLSPSLYDRVISACAAAGFSPHVDHQAGHMMTYISLVAIGAGISLVPASMAKAGMAGVTFVRLKGPVPYSEVSLAWNPHNVSPVLARVLELLKRGSAKLVA
jgi:DNA-binding transcriptional LysR family regulator